MKKLIVIAMFAVAAACGGRAPSESMAAPEQSMMPQNVLDGSFQLADGEDPAAAVRSYVLGHYASDGSRRVLVSCWLYATEADFRFHCTDAASAGAKPDLVIDVDREAN